MELTHSTRVARSGRLSSNVIGTKMKKFVISFISIPISMGLIYFGLLYSTERLDEIALSETNKIKNEIERIQTTKGKFPQDMDKFL